MAQGDGGRESMIVVGVDGSESSKEALRWADHQAELTSSSLRALTVWTYAGGLGWDARYQPGFEPQNEARRVLDATIDDVVGPERAHHVERLVVEGHPAPALLDAAAEADLLVVGSRGHGAFTGMLIGSVSAHCVSHARCPVVVVHNHRSSKDTLKT